MKKLTLTQRMNEMERIHSARMSSLEGGFADVVGKVKSLERRVNGNSSASVPPSETATVAISKGPDVQALLSALRMWEGRAIAAETIIAKMAAAMGK